MKISIRNFYLGVLSAGVLVLSAGCGIHDDPRQYAAVLEIVHPFRSWPPRDYIDGFEVVAVDGHSVTRAHHGFDDVIPDVWLEPGLRTLKIRKLRPVADAGKEFTFTWPVEAGKFYGIAMTMVGPVLFEDIPH
jgi:hypothetical protein